MKKRGLVLGVLFFGLTLFSGCDIQSPVGTVSVQYDSDKKSESVTYVDDAGNKREIDVKSVKNVVDKMLGNVALPQGASKDDLEGFINESLSTVGLDIDSLTRASDSDKDKFIETLKGKLQKSGVDIDEIDFDAIVGNKKEDSSESENKDIKKVKSKKKSAKKSKKK